MRCSRTLCRPPRSMYVPLHLLLFLRRTDKRRTDKPDIHTFFAKFSCRLSLEAVLFCGLSPGAHGGNSTIWLDCLVSSALLTLDPRAAVCLKRHHRRTSSVLAC